MMAATLFCLQPTPLDPSDPLDSHPSLVTRIQFQLARIYHQFNNNNVIPQPLPLSATPALYTHTRDTTCVHYIDIYIICPLCVFSQCVCCLYCVRVCPPSKPTRFHLEPIGFVLFLLDAPCPPYNCLVNITNIHWHTFGAYQIMIIIIIIINTYNCMHIIIQYIRLRLIIIHLLLLL